MRAVVQRVSSASVSVHGALVGSITRGLLVLLGVSKHDADADLDYIVQKSLGLRIFPDAEARMNLSIADVQGSILLVSQFTLYADARKGRRPSFDLAAAPAEAEHWYELAIGRLKNAGIHTEAGLFRADMQVASINDGPVTILLDSSRAF